MKDRIEKAENVFIVSRKKALSTAIDHLERASEILEAFEEANLSNLIDAMVWVVQDKRDDENE